MAIPFTLSPSATYASKPNLKFPGTQAQATAAEVAAAARVTDVLPAGLGFTVAGGTIKLAT